MKLLTKDIENNLPRLYATDKVKPEDKILVAKFFDPSGRGTWYATEGERIDGDFMFFGYVVSPLTPDFDEWGYFSLNELKRVRNRFGLGIERDRHFKSRKFSEVIK